MWKPSASASKQTNKQVVSNEVQVKTPPKTIKTRINRERERERRCSCSYCNGLNDAMDASTHIQSRFTGVCITNASKPCILYIIIIGIHHGRANAFGILVRKQRRLWNDTLMRHRERERERRRETAASDGSIPFETRYSIRYTAALSSSSSSSSCFPSLLSQLLRIRIIVYSMGKINPKRLKNTNVIEPANDLLFYYTILEPMVFVCCMKFVFTALNLSRLILMV